MNFKFFWGWGRGLNVLFYHQLKKEKKKILTKHSKTVSNLSIELMNIISFIPGAKYKPLYDK